MLDLHMVKITLKNFKKMEDYQGLINGHIRRLVLMENKLHIPLMSKYFVEIFFVFIAKALFTSKQIYIR